MNTELLDCDHQKTSFVQSGDGLDSRHEIRICERCGQIMFWMVKEGISFEMNFHIHDPAQLDMMRKWTDYVWAETGGRP